MIFNENGDIVNTLNRCNKLLEQILVSVYNKLPYGCTKVMIFANVTDSNCTVSCDCYKKDKKSIPFYDMNTIMSISRMFKEIRNEYSKVNPNGDKWQYCTLVYSSSTGKCETDFDYNDNNISFDQYKEKQRRKFL